MRAGPASKNSHQPSVSTSVPPWDPGMLDLWHSQGLSGCDDLKWTELNWSECDWMAEMYVKKIWIEHNWIPVRGSSWIQMYNSISGVVYEDIVFQRGLPPHAQDVSDFSPNVSTFLKRCPGRYLGISGRYPIVSKSNRSHVDIFRFSFVKLRYSLYIPLKMFGKFVWGLELQLVISQTQRAARGQRLTTGGRRSMQGSWQSRKLIKFNLH
jgi:hypothetical protein